MSIAKSTLSKDIFNSIYTHLNTPANLSDPSTRKKQWIYASFPDVTANNFVGYPFIVINPIAINRDKETLDNNGFNITTTLTIIVYGQKAKDVADLTDKIRTLFIGVISPISEIDFDGVEEETGQTLINGKFKHYTALNFAIEVRV